MTVRFGRWLRIVVAISSLLLGASLVAVWVANLALTRTVDDTVDGEAVVNTMLVLGWVVIVLTGVVVLGLAVGAWLHRPLWARGVALVMAGMTLYWGWWLLDRRVDLFGMAALGADDAELYTRAEARLWTTLGIDVVAVLALLLGGVLLLRHREPELESEPEPDADVPGPEVADAETGPGAD
ncbi:MAG: hypothetical protein KDB60_04620 [Propionibacteriaceae bacterium]|nr:hypothetical protein [Propionibacteriaceae bacterium]